MSSVDTFIKRAERIYGKFRKAPTLTHNAQTEGRALLKQFENYLKTKGLKVPTRAKREPKARHYSQQQRPGP